MRSRILTSLSLSLAVLVLPVASVNAAAVVSVEAGVYSNFAAPDPDNNNPGSITFGMDNPNTAAVEAPAEVIAADAIIVQPANVNFGDHGFAPTCVEVTRDGGSITKLAIVASCTVSGSVVLYEDVFGPGAGAYIVGQGRIFVPAADVAANPQLATLIKTAADSGGTVNITFAVDVSYGFPVSFVGVTQIAGAVTILSNGDVTVGSATLPNAVIDAASRAKLQQAVARNVTATVDITGDNVIDLSGASQPVVITLSVTLPAPAPVVVPTPAPVNPAPETPNTPTFVTNRAQANPGGNVLATGEGFKPNSAVKIYLHSQPVLLATVTADENGAFSISVRIPASAPTGSHTIEALGVDSYGNSLSMRQGLVLVAAETSMPDTAMQPVDAGMLSVLGLLLAVVAIRLGFARRLALLPTRS